MLALDVLRVQQNSSPREIMTTTERELALKITTGQTLGAGIFMNEVEYKAYAARAYGITEQRITELVRELLEGG